ncbi:YggT family protein [Pediococcus claussenii]|uniref:YGGT family protein n=1 Tax=Pediococcus claussenii (strain ATCC BAA-344 / DSM 14800 / JCM 18046 / KCTC 3811 / LMG 21948 / P06) TaxID=701521 RepID=G8PCU8_PEDCP|nr:YggT family protein [Pediococcus claussenii]AEV95083.1 hypothetical protein PECL_810 [Pediococcus claussenii ATCC BAA-344]ANZ70271.1 cell division protein [Pediococcus claussenii]ANZ72087.1 cell division protein [Pediococcus claussenii]
MIFVQFFSLLQVVIQIYMLLIFVWVLMSWLPGARQSALGRFIDRICEPYMRWFRFIPPFFGIDFSPVIALFVLDLVMQGIQYISILLFGM